MLSGGSYCGGRCGLFSNGVPCADYIQANHSLIRLFTYEHKQKTVCFPGVHCYNRSVQKTTVPLVQCRWAHPPHHCSACALDGDHCCPALSTEWTSGSSVVRSALQGLGSVFSTWRWPVSTLMLSIKKPSEMVLNDDYSQSLQWFLYFNVF